MVRGEEVLKEEGDGGVKGREKERRKRRGGE